MGPGVREQEAAEATHCFLFTACELQEVLTCLHVPELGREGSGTAGASAGAQAEMGKEGRLRGYPDCWPSPASPLPSPALWLLCQFMSLSSVSPHPLPHSWLIPVLHPCPQLGAGAHLAPPPLPRPQGLSSDDYPLPILFLLLLFSHSLHDWSIHLLCESHKESHLPTRTSLFIVIIGSYFIGFHGNPSIRAP